MNFKIPFRKILKICCLISLTRFNYHSEMYPDYSNLPFTMTDVQAKPFLSKGVLKTPRLGYLIK